MNKKLLHLIGIYIVIIFSNVLMCILVNMARNESNLDYGVFNFGVWNFLLGIYTVKIMDSYFMDIDKVRRKHIYDIVIILWFLCEALSWGGGAILTRRIFDIK